MCCCLGRSVDQAALAADVARRLGWPQRGWALSVEGGLGRRAIGMTESEVVPGDTGRDQGMKAAERKGPEITRQPQQM